MTITVLNQKGGVGKTTTLNLGAALANSGYKVLLADLDLQCDLVAYQSTLSAPNIIFAATEASALERVMNF